MFSTKSEVEHNKHIQREGFEIWQMRQAPSSEPHKQSYTTVRDHIFLRSKGLIKHLSYGYQEEMKLCPAELAICST